MNLRPRLDSLYIYLLMALVGYAIADLATLNLRDKMMPEKLPPVARKPPPMPTVTDRSRYNLITTKNMFNSDGKISDPMGLDPNQKNNNPDAPPILSQLPLTLVGTLVHVNPERSLATIGLRNKNEQKPFMVNDDVDGLAKITKIERNKVIMRNNNTGRLEYIEIKEDSKINFGVSAIKVDGEVVVKDENDREIKRSDVDKYISDLPGLLQQARAIPNTGPDGRINGFRIMDLQPGSIYERLGVRRNDVIQSVNGEPVDSPSKAMELYNALKGSNSISLGVERNGRTENLNFNITQ